MLVVVRAPDATGGASQRALLAVFVERADAWFLT